MDSLTVELGERSYPILIGADILNNSAIKDYILGRQVMIVTNTTIAPLYLDQLCDALQDFTVNCTVLPDGEQYKTLDYVNNIYDQLLQNTHNRTTTLIALGGGVVGDMAGFAAASYQRGVNFIQIPTTLLSQVDSSVGGKTGVNHALGKNMIGAFYQPKLVIADVRFFATLKHREFAAGLSEVIKYGLIYDAEFFHWLELNIEKLTARDETALCYAIKRSCEIKAEVVAEDEKEHGIRAWLNLGHTFGHAIETHQGYGKWLHGEAVAAGTMMALDMSQRLGWIDTDIVQRTNRLFEIAKLPTRAPKDMSLNDFVSLMGVDKKVLHGNIRLVLIESLGRATVTDKFDFQLLEDTIVAAS